MSTPFAESSLRLGRSLVDLLSDATMAVGAADPVPGMFDRQPELAPVGEAGMRARLVMFTCLTTALIGLAVDEGTEVTVTHRGSATTWRVAEGGRTDWFECGQTELLLEAR